MNESDLDSVGPWFAPFLLIPLIFLSVAFAFAKPPAHHPTPTPTPFPSRGPVEKGGMVCRTKQVDLELRDWIGGIQIQAEQAIKTADEATKSNAELKVLLDKSIQDGQALANECQKDKACARAPLSCWFHRLMRHIFWITGAIIVILIALIVASFFFPALGPVLNFLVSIWKWFISLFTRKTP